MGNSALLTSMATNLTRDSRKNKELSQTTEKLAQNATRSNKEMNNVKERLGD